MERGDQLLETPRPTLDYGLGCAGRIGGNMLQRELGNGMLLDDLAADFACLINA